MTTPPTRIVTTTGSVLYVHKPHSQVVERIEQAQRHGHETVSLDNRRVNVAQITAITPPEDGGHAPLKAGAETARGGSRSARMRPMVFRSGSPQ